MKTKNFVLIVICCVIVACAKTQSKEINLNNQKKEFSVDENLKKVNFSPDSTVNKSLVLHNDESSKRFYSDILSLKLIEDLRESPVIGFKTKNGKEYLLVYQYEGGIKNAFSCFEIGFVGNDEKDFIFTNYNQFKTESGVKLGMSMEDLIKIKGKDYKKEENKIIYQITDLSKSQFLQNYQMPSYFLECTFKNNKMVKIKYGFDYP